MKTSSRSFSRPVSVRERRRMVSEPEYRADQPSGNVYLITRARRMGPPFSVMRLRVFGDCYFLPYSHINLGYKKGPSLTRPLVFSLLLLGTSSVRFRLRAFSSLVHTGRPGHSAPLFFDQMVLIGDYFVCCGLLSCESAIGKGIVWPPLLWA